MVKIIILNLFIWIFAQPPPVQIPATKILPTGKIKEEMKKLRSLEPSDFLQKIDNYRNIVERFIEHKKRVCSGEFSKVVLGEETVGKERKKLTKEEKDSCFSELLSLHVTYIDNLFVARSRFLAHQHEIRMKNLDSAKIKSIENIKGKFTKKKKT